MGKTERILSYLPPLYRPYPQPPLFRRAPSLLYLMTDAVGRLMGEADELLVTVMRAHWVDFADKGRPRIDDLAKLAALFDLQPRDDEDVETFRTHLKSYIRTYLEGSATPRGVLRLAASTLALSLEQELEPRLGDPPAIIVEMRAGEDAAMRLFGVDEAEVRGTPPGPARLVGLRDLSAGADLSAGGTLQIAVDGDEIAIVDVAGADPRATTPWEAARAINAALGVNVASHDGRTLSLTSLDAGEEASVVISTPEGDAADALLGLAPPVHKGIEARPAAIIGQRDHAPSGGVALIDLRGARYLRVALDGQMPVEVDCAGPDIAATTLDEARDAINAALGAEVASHDGHRLTLTSPTSGRASRVELPAAPAEDARAKLLGDGARSQGRGADAAPGRFVGRADLSATVDLTTRRMLRLQVDGGAEQEIDCAGDQPDATAASEIVARINGALAAPVAATDGRRITLTSLTSGPDSRIEVLPTSDPDVDATEIILGVAPRTVLGTPPDRAVLTGLPVEEPLDLRRLRKLWLGVDGGELLQIDIAGADPARTTLQEVADRINDAAGTTVALPLDGRLVLQSPTTGAESAIVLRAPVERRPRFFYTRGRVRDDAATQLFGFVAGEAEGRLPEPARLTGTVDLSRGADLRVGHTLLIQLDDRDPKEIFVANPARPLVTTLDHIVQVINGPDGFDAPVASVRDGRLELTSVVEGPSGRVAFGISSASDAGELILGLPQGSEARGRAADVVTFVGMGDLARGLDIRETFRLRLGVDERPVAEVDLSAGWPEGSPPILSPAQVAIAINQALGADYASHDGRRIVVTSRRAGEASRVTIELAGENDATAAVFGLAEGRSYQGQEATQARLLGTVPLGEGVQLGARRHLSLEIDGELVADVDCAGKDTGPTALADLVKRINARAGRPVAGELEGKLAILSPSRGAGSSVVLRVSHAADARAALMGDAPAEALGAAGTPAELRGTARLTRPVDLSRRSLIRLRLDGGETHEIDCAGETPGRTFADEIVAKLDAVLPGAATIDAEQHLVIRAARRVELLAQRHFTLYEFAPAPARTPDQELRFGATWEVESASIRAEPAAWTLRSLSGVDRPRLTNRDSGAWVMVDAVIPAGFTLHVRVDDEGALRAWEEAPGRPTRDLGDRVRAGMGASAEPPETVARAVAAALSLAAGRSRWLYTDCYGDRYNAAYFGRRPRRGRQRALGVVPAHFAGGETCHAPGVFNQSRFYDSDQPGTETVFGTREAQARPQAVTWFSYASHRAGQFELELPADLPPQFGGRFNQARFAARGAPELPEPNVVYRDAIFDLPSDPRALQEQIEASQNIIVARDTFIEEEQIVEGGEFPLYKGAPLYRVPFNVPRPLAGGGPGTHARAYLEQPGVEFAVELIAREPGSWGNLIQVSAPESATPGGFDVAVLYTGQDVFENARQKVAAQVALARAAGVLGEVTRR
jgi:hypothetical protein